MLCVIHALTVLFEKKLRANIFNSQIDLPTNYCVLLLFYQV